MEMLREREFDDNPRPDSRMSELGDIEREVIMPQVQSAAPSLRPTQARSRWTKASLGVSADTGIRAAVSVPCCMSD